LEEKGKQLEELKEELTAERTKRKEEEQNEGTLKKERDALRVHAFTLEQSNKDVMAL